MGELNTRTIISDSILINIFGQLLQIPTDDVTEEAKLTNDHVEGAVILMERVGIDIDKKISKIAAKRMKEEKEGKGLGKKDKQEQQFQRIFNRFSEIIDTENPNQKIENRIKLLIKNMLENRKDNWSKTQKKADAGPKKVEDVRAEVERKHAQAAAERETDYQNERYQSQGSYYDKRGGKQGGRGGDRGRHGRDY